MLYICVTNIRFMKYGTVRIKEETVNLVRDNKVRTGVPVNVFFEQAALEKLDKQKSIAESNRPVNKNRNDNKIK